MAWAVLVLSAMLEAVWANALGASEGLTRLVPTLIFLGALIPSMLTLAYVARQIPVSTAYAVWAGLGAVFTAGWAMVVGDEPITTARVTFLVAIVGSVVGLKIIGPRPRHAALTSAD